MNLEKIVAVAAAESVRQGVSYLGDWELPEPGGFIGLLRAYDYAWGKQKNLPTEDDLLYMATMIDPRNKRQYRKIPVVFDNGMSHPPDAREVPELMAGLVGYLPPVASADEWVKAFLDIHPFVDGNGRVAWILYNWMHLTLDDPAPLPDFYKPQDVKRIYRKGLAALDPNGRPCEVCNRPMADHDWADMDENGFVVNCPFGASAQ